MEDGASILTELLPATATDGIASNANLLRSFLKAIDEISSKLEQRFEQDLSALAAIEEVMPNLMRD